MATSVIAQKRTDTFIIALLTILLLTIVLGNIAQKTDYVNPAPRPYGRGIGEFRFALFLSTLVLTNGALWCGVNPFSDYKNPFDNLKLK